MSNKFKTRLSDEQRRRIKIVVKKTHAIERVLSRVMPEEEQDLVCTVGIDLADFWEIAEKHRLRVKELLELEGPKDKRKLAKMLSDLCYNDMYAHLPYHARSMRKTLPDLIDRLESKKRKRVALSKPRLKRSKLRVP